MAMPSLTPEQRAEYRELFRQSRQRRAESREKVLRAIERMRARDEAARRRRRWF